MQNINENLNDDWVHVIKLKSKKAKGDTKRTRRLTRQRKRPF